MPIDEGEAGSLLPAIVRSSCLNPANQAESDGDHPSLPSLVTWRHPLVLHFDINETILIGDEAGGDSREDVINKMLAKSAFVQIPKGMSREETFGWQPRLWWNGESLKEIYSSDDVPPPLYTGWDWPTDSCPYYRTGLRRQAKTFVRHHGAIYRGMYELLNQKLSIDPGVDPQSPLAHLLPALFETLVVLSNRQIRHRLVFRSFGTDLADVAAALTEFATGRHPSYTNFVNQEYKMESAQLYSGTWVFCERSQEYQYQLSQNGRVCARGDEQVLQVLQQHTACGIRDDYEFWSAQGCAPWAGKPVWQVDEAHHILLDDNIHNLTRDCIACIRTRKQGQFKTLPSSEALKLQGIHLIRVPTIEPVLNPQWFLTQIDRAVQRRSEAFVDGA